MLTKYLWTKMEMVENFSEMNNPLRDLIYDVQTLLILFQVRHIFSAYL